MVTPDFEPRGSVIITDVTRRPEDIAQAAIVSTLGDIVTNQSKERFILTFWSDFQAVVTITGTAADLSLPSVVVLGIPTGAVIESVVALFKFRSIFDTSGSANDFDGDGDTPAIQVKETAAGSFLDAIDIVNEMLTIGADETQPGDVWIGNTDIKAEVDTDDTYAFQIDQAEATGSNLLLRDVQCGLRIEYSIA